MLFVINEHICISCIGGREFKYFCNIYINNR